MRPNLLESTTVLKIIELEKEIKELKQGITIINLLNKELDENNKKLEEDKKQLEQNLENQQKENTGKLKTLEERLKTENIKKSQTENEIKEFKTEISKLKEEIAKKELEYAKKFENQIFAIKSQLYEEKANSDLDVIERDQKIVDLNKIQKNLEEKIKELSTEIQILVKEKQEKHQPHLTEDQPSQNTPHSNYDETSDTIAAQQEQIVDLNKKYSQAENLISELQLKLVEQDPLPEKFIILQKTSTEIETNSVEISTSPTITNPQDLDEFADLINKINDDVSPDYNYLLKKISTLHQNNFDFNTNAAQTLINNIKNNAYAQRKLNDAANFQLVKNAVKDNDATKLIELLKENKPLIYYHDDYSDTAISASNCSYLTYILKEEATKRLQEKLSSEISEEEKTKFINLFTKCQADITEATKEIATEPEEHTKQKTWLERIVPACLNLPRNI